MMQEVNTAETGHEVDAGVVQESTLETAPADATKDASVTIAEKSTATAYFTNGEMLPWKGKWWRVRLLEINGERIIGLVMQKDTGSALKRAERKQRWQQQHPKAVAPRA